MAVLESLKDYRISRNRIDVKTEYLGVGGYSDVKRATLYSIARWLGKSRAVAVKQLRASGNRVERTHIAFVSLTPT
jgi:hypothetical protein